jgi:very-short-patch-repair endonuclease
VAKEQLARAGLSPKAIAHRLRTGRLHQLHSGVYAVGRPDVSQEGRWLSAVLACGPDAALSFGSAAALWKIERETARVEVSINRSRRQRHPGVFAHRPMRLDADELRVVDAIPVTGPARTLIDLASRLPQRRVEAAISAADRLELIDPEALRRELADQRRPLPRGVRPLRRLLASQTFALTDSELERAFLALVKRAGLAQPDTGTRLNGFKVDFYWPELGLIVETDGLRYHRTASQQARDRRRDQVQAAAGIETLRFTNAQVRFEPEVVIGILRQVTRRLGTARGHFGPP